MEKEDIRKRVIENLIKILDDAAKETATPEQIKIVPEVAKILLHTTESEIENCKYGSTGHLYGTQPPSAKPRVPETFVYGNASHTHTMYTHTHNIGKGETAKKHTHGFY